jgi:glycosyltransferase involved in cell wall biosynthesis
VVYNERIMTKNPVTAIITRTKNRPLLLDRALASIAAQSSKDYIHVVLNDGGDKKIVEKILQKYPDDKRVVIHNDSSIGLTRALNQAIKSVKSDYIAILDDDDTWHPERVARVAEYLNEHDQEPGVAVAMVRIIEEIQGEEVVEISRNAWYEGVTEVVLYDQLLDNYLTNNCITYRRTLYEELNGYDESLEVAEDWDFGVRYLLHYDINFLPEVLAYYHHRPEDKSDNANSVFSGVDVHKRNLNKLRNRYLRDDINSGKLGVGYVMNQLHDNSIRRAEQLKVDVENVVRIEGHINHVENDLIQKLEALIYHHTSGGRIKSKIRNMLKRS